MTDVLILTASFGNGHNSASRGLVDHIDSLFPDMTVEIRDLFAITTPLLKGALEDTYRTLTKHGVSLYNAIYSLRDHKENLLDDLWLKLHYARFAQAVDQLNPRMIISVFPTCAQFAARYKEDHPSVRTITVLTDVVDSWEWIHGSTDMYCVPAEHVKQRLINKHIAPERIFITGIPVKKGFDGSIQTLGEPQVRFSRSIKKKRVLMLGSAMGKFSLKSKTIETLGLLPYHFTVVTGQDQALYDQLAGMDLPDNFTLLGYTEHIAQLMNASDVVVTKPGGATIFEAIESNLPILVQPSNVGQESKNREFVERYGFGDSFTDGEELVKKIESMLADEHYAEAIKKNMQNFKAQSEWAEVYMTLRRW